MDRDFWLGLWERGEPGFHERAANVHLVARYPELSVPEGGRVFLPLCGKTRDLGWMMDKGYRVAGVELSELAITQLFAELGLAPFVAPVGTLHRYSATGIDIFVGDFFDLGRDALGPVDAVYDRAALIALPPELRPRYVAHLAGVSAAAPNLLISFEYDPDVMHGPPYSVADDEVRRLYGANYAITLLERNVIEGGIRGKPAHDSVWLMRAKN